MNPINTHKNSGHCGEHNRCKSLFDQGHVYCVGGADADQGMKDSCNGDSGSPVSWLDPATNKETVVGVIILGSEEPSNDQRCGAVGRHSVITQVNAYSAWIANTVKGQQVSPFSDASIAHFSLSCHRCDLGWPQRLGSSGVSLPLTCASSMCTFFLASAFARFHSL